MNNKTTANITTLGMLITVQFIFLFAPLETVSRFVYFRPLFYLFALIMYLVLSGGYKDGLAPPKAAKANLIAAIGFVLYISVVFFLGVFFGFGINAAAPTFKIILSNLWSYGTIFLMTEVIRYKVIGGASSENRVNAAYALTFISAFMQLDSLRGFFEDLSYEYFTEFFFAALFPDIALSGVLCYMAFEGSLTSLVVIRLTYSLIPLVSPFLPNVNKTTFAVLTSGLLIVTVVFYYIFMDDRSKEIRRRDRLRGEFIRRSRTVQIITLGVVAVLAAFMLRVFTFFPVVILTGSMTGTINQGSVVFVEKINPDDVAETVIAGDIILFKNDKVEMMHRVIEILYHTDGTPYYQTKGDANPEADPFTIEQRQVVGLTKSFIPYIGYPVVVIKSLF